MHHRLRVPHNARRGQIKIFTRARARPTSASEVTFVFSSGGNVKTSSPARATHELPYGNRLQALLRSVLTQGR